MQSLKEKISNEILNIVRDFGVNIESISIQEPEDFSHGDLTSNIGMQIAKDLKSNPIEIAKKIIERLPKYEEVEKIEVVNPGFINFFLSEKYLLDTLKGISEQKEEYFKLNTLNGKRYVIEYTDPNPFKILHIGHLYTNMVGESFARLVEAVGGSVVRANYQGDVGLHVAKTLWGLIRILREKGITFSQLSEMDLVEKVRILGDSYMLGFKMYDDEKDGGAINEIKGINYYIFSLYIPSLERKDCFDEFDGQGIKEMYMESRKWCLEYFERIYKRTGTKFDRYYFESEMGERGLEMVKKNIDNGIFEESDGSVIYKGDESKGLHTRVFVNSEGLPTYEAKEIALAFKKFEEFAFDRSIVITANEQSPYFKVVFDAISQLNSDIANRSLHLSHGMVKLPGAEKMSSRKGKILEGEWLLDETKKKVEDLMKSNGKYSEVEISEISDVVGVSAIKYSFIKVSVGKDVIFDFDSATSFDGDTGPYLQYVYARCKSILREGSSGRTGNRSESLDAYSKELLRLIGKVDTVVLLSATNFSPSLLCSYLFDLGQSFNAFYQNIKVIGSGNSALLLDVVEATAITMKYGLNILGIDVVEKM